MSSLFYLTIPGPTGGPLYWIMYIFAVLACLVASQVSGIRSPDWSLIADPTLFVLVVDDDYRLLLARPAAHQL